MKPEDFCYCDTKCDSSHRGMGTHMVRWNTECKNPCYADEKRDDWGTCFIPPMPDNPADGHLDAFCVADHNDQSESSNGKPWFIVVPNKPAANWSGFVGGTDSCFINSDPPTVEHQDTGSMCLGDYGLDNCLK